MGGVFACGILKLGRFLFLVESLTLGFEIQKSAQEIRNPVYDAIPSTDKESGIQSGINGQTWGVLALKNPIQSVIRCDP